MNCHFENWDFQVKMAEGTFTSNFIPSKSPNKATIKRFFFKRYKLTRTGKTGAVTTATPFWKQESRRTNDNGLSRSRKAEYKLAVEKTEPAWFTPQSLQRAWELTAPGTSGTGEIGGGGYSKNGWELFEKWLKLQIPSLAPHQMATATPSFRQKPESLFSLDGAKREPSTGESTHLRARVHQQ